MANQLYTKAKQSLLGGELNLSSNVVVITSYSIHYTKLYDMEAGGEIETDCKFFSLSGSKDELIIKTSKGDVKSKI